MVVSTNEGCRVLPKLIPKNGIVVLKTKVGWGIGTRQGELGG